MTAKIQPSPIDECSTCRYWDAVKENMGICRRNPPTKTGVEAYAHAKHILGNWPLAGCADWCGEWQLNPLCPD